MRRAALVGLGALLLVAVAALARPPRPSPLPVVAATLPCPVPPPPRPAPAVAPPSPLPAVDVVDHQLALGSDPDPARRREALRALDAWSVRMGPVHSADAREALERASRSDPDPLVRREALDAVLRHRTGLGLQALESRRRPSRFSR